MSTLRNVVIVSIFCLYPTLGNAQDINATASISGKTGSLNLTATIYPSAEFIGNGSKIWLAVWHQGSLIFHGGNLGIVLYQGGDAPPFLSISRTRETFTFEEYNSTSILGDDLYVGYGTSFADMLNNSRYKKIHTFTAIPTAFKKMDNDGNALPDSASNWSCVLDTQSGLLWEVKTNDGGLRDKDWVYTAYESIGSNGVGICDSSKTCNQKKFTAAVNSVGLCGKKDWRLPRLSELEYLLDKTKTSSPYIDTQYFPFTEPSKYWTEPNWGFNLNVWSVDFGDTQSRNTRFLDLQYHVRLVRP